MNFRATRNLKAWRRTHLVMLERESEYYKNYKKKASELSTLLGSDTEKQSEASTSNQSSSVRRSYMPSFRTQFHPSSNTFRGKGKGKGKSVVKGSFMRDVISLPGPNVNKAPRQTKQVWLIENGFVISGFQL